MTESWRILGDWSFSFAGQVMQVPPPVSLPVIGEYHWALPPYRQAGGWNDGVALHGVAASNCALAGALLPAKVEVRLDDVVMERGRDYDFNPVWGTLGRLEGGRIGTGCGVYIDYAYVPMRLDSVVQDSQGGWQYRLGLPASACPRPPQLAAGDRRRLNVYLDAAVGTLVPECFYPVLETEYSWPDATAQQECLPRSMATLRHGGSLRILAWGDSVTEAAYLPRSARWQEQVLSRLQRLYPQARLDLQTHGWAGYAMQSFLQAPAASAHAFRRAVLDSGADLVISEFVNDARLSPESWAETYPQVLAALRGSGMEWLILTPHYVRPDWMGLPGQNGPAVTEDPRPFVHFLRQFAVDHGLALADSARRYGRLWRRGIPYNTLMTNAINHPDELGMRIFADAAMAVFGENGRDTVTF